MSTLPVQCLASAYANLTKTVFASAIVWTSARTISRLNLNPRDAAAFTAVMSGIAYLTQPFFREAKNYLVQPVWNRDNKAINDGKQNYSKSHKYSNFVIAWIVLTKVSTDLLGFEIPFAKIVAVAGITIGVVEVVSPYINTAKTAYQEWTRKSSEE